MTIKRRLAFECDGRREVEGMDIPCGEYLKGTIYEKKSIEMALWFGWEIKDDEKCFCPKCKKEFGS